jgi:predicted Zn finger-like uncharacterized protein
MFWMIAIILGIICAVLASYKGRSVVGWFFIGFLFGIFGLIVLLVISNLKEAKTKEEHVEMEQRRLREQLRQERLKTEQFRKYTQVRLDTHDRELDIDTRHIGPLLQQANIQPAIDNGQEFSEEAVRIEPEIQNRRIKIQCPHCQARFKVPHEHKGKKTKCPKCTQPFVIARFVESTAVEGCTSCGRKIGKAEQAYVSDGRVVCKQCDETLRQGSIEADTKSAGWFYQKQDNAVGPFSLEKLKGLIQNGKIESSTCVWHESLDEWIPANEVGELDTETNHG